jgi:hypothetical protein
MAQYIRHEPDPGDPGALLVRFLPGEIMILRGPEREAFLRKIDDLDPPPKAPGERRPSSPRVTLHEDMPEASATRPRRKRRRV